MAAAAKVPIDSYKKYELGKAVPGGEALASLARAGVDIAAVLGTRPPSAAEPAPRAGYVYVPLYDVRAAAGHGAVAQSEGVVNELAFREDWIRSTLHVRPSDLSLVHVEGDSMEPDLRAGDIILIDHTDASARREGIYVLRMEDALLVKQVQRMPGGVLRLVSRNPAYEPILLPIPEVQPGGKVSIIGRVVWACRRL